MKETTLCYIENNHCYLMLHRTRKAGDPNRDKWLGIGGHIEPGETAAECILREALEETGLTLLDCTCRGIVHFRSDCWEDEEMHLYTATRFRGELIPCSEGDLEWVDKDRLWELPLWEGDRIFLELLNAGAPSFDLTLEYRGEKLMRATLNGADVTPGGTDKGGL